MDISLTEVHEMKKGESLWKIGKDIGINWRFIKAMNQDTIKNEKLIQIGQKIIVPNKLLVRVITEIYDLISCFAPIGYGAGLIFDILAYFATGGSITKKEIGMFCAAKSIDANFSIKIWAIYEVLGKTNKWAKVSSYIYQFINYGLIKLIDCLQQ
ncbi:hypothetical protein ABPG73_005961 [Tetrahymena malaccensis]